MTPNLTTLPADIKTTHYLSNAETAEYLRLSPRTLEKLRVLGGGPRFHKFGRRVIYALCDLEEWAKARTFDSTSDPDYSAYRPLAN